MFISQHQNLGSDDLRMWSLPQASNMAKLHILCRGESNRVVRFGPPCHATHLPGWLTEGSVAERGSRLKNLLRIYRRVY